jgi:hypothetical protein
LHPAQWHLGFHHSLKNDGPVAAAVGRQRPDLTTTGVDVRVRRQTRIPVQALDGDTLPFRDDAADVVTFVDVTFVDVPHHASDPTVLLR